MRLPKLKSFLILAILAGVVVFLLVGPLRGPGCADLRAEQGLVSVAVSNLRTDTAQLFCYRDEAGRKLRFVLGRDSDGRLHAVLDACRQCYTFHKGYQVSHGNLICRLCGNRYKLKNMEAGKASCMPVPLRFQMHGDVVQVEASDLKAARWLF